MIPNNEMCQIRAPKALHAMIRHLRACYKQALDVGCEMTVTIRLGEDRSVTSLTVLKGQSPQDRLVG
jgi:hypothetical protein